MVSIEYKRSGVTNLSQLAIDADKDWNAKGISNAKELASSMAQGDVMYRGASVIERLAAGSSGQFLKTQGAAANPIWDSQAAVGLSVDDDIWLIDDWSHWTEYVSGSGSFVSKGLRHIRAMSGATIDSKAILYHDYYYTKTPRSAGAVVNYDNEVTIVAVFDMVECVANGKMYINLDTNWDVVNPTTKSVGFRLDNLTVKGLVHDGSTLTETTLFTLSTYEPVILKLVHTPGSKIEFFKNGVSQATQTTNLPSGNSNVGQRFKVGVTNGGTGATYDIDFVRAAIKSKWY